MKDKESIKSIKGVSTRLSADFSAKSLQARSTKPGLLEMLQWRLLGEKEKAATWNMKIMKGKTSW